MKKLWMILASVLLLVGLFTTSGCENPFAPDELKPDANGVYTFTPDDMPQVVFAYNKNTWLMSVKNKASLPVNILIRRHDDNSTGVRFTLNEFQSHSYTEYYEIGKNIRITITRDGIPTNFVATLN